MKKKLNCILLVDDSGADNFLHEMVITDADCSNKVVAIQSGQKALEYLQSEENGEHPRPALIFLDINMPGMDGWEFLEKYKALDKSQQSKIIVVMLTTSPNPDDKAKAQSIPEISEYINKPLTEEILLNIIESYFPDNAS